MLKRIQENMKAIPLFRTPAMKFVGSERPSEPLFPAANTVKMQKVHALRALVSAQDWHVLKVSVAMGFNRQEGLRTR